MPAKVLEQLVLAGAAIADGLGPLRQLQESGSCGS